MIYLRFKKNQDFGDWYEEILRKADLVDTRYGVKGFFVYKSNLMSLIHLVTLLFKKELERTGHKEMMFPPLIPFSFFQKESEHIPGLEDSVFYITRAGKHKFHEELILRPTSETAIYPLLPLWIKGKKDLPFKIYQNVSMYRYETRSTKPLIRGREFIWIESHTAHHDDVDANNQINEDIECIRKIIDEDLCIPFFTLDRPDWDKFAGAERSISLECLLPNGHILQLGTLHFFGRKFAQIFGIEFEEEAGVKKFVSQTVCRLVVSRIIATLISIHGDDFGLVFPFKIAPQQVAIIPILRVGQEEIILSKCDEIRNKLEKEAGIRVFLDNSPESVGSKFYNWEIIGTPFRLEIGLKEINEGEVTVFQRDIRKRIKIREDELTDLFFVIGENLKVFLREKAVNALNQKIKKISKKEELTEIMPEESYVLKMNFCDQKECLDEIKDFMEIHDIYDYDLRGYLLEADEKHDGSCIGCGEEAKSVAIMARSY